MSTPIQFDRCELRSAERQLLIDGKPAPLGARAFDLLVTLVERRDRVVTKDELFDTVWPGLVVEENNLQVQVSSLRRLLGPNAIATVPGRGYRFVAPLDAGRASTAKASEEAPAPPNNLPHARTRFIGREAALADCAKLLRETRLLTLSGIGGCGKTRLAQELAQRQLSAFPDGVWFVDLAPLQEAQRVSATVATTLGVQAGQLTDYLKTRRALIVMDNCEHVIGAAAKSIEALLEACGALKIIATSRELLGTAGEQIFAVRSLLLPVTSDVDEIRRSEAVHLFVDHARLLLPEFDIDERNGSAIAEICRRLDGIPLAIELAAARIRVMDVDDIRARLDDRFRLLTGGSRALPRHQTLQATMQWSHDLLTPAEQRLFRRLAVFAGSCTHAAAAAVNGDGADEYEVLERLTALHDKSLLMVDRDTQAQPRYRMLETVRQYAEERLNEVGESDEVRTRHLLHYVAMVEKAPPKSPGPRQELIAMFRQVAMLRQEEENLLAAHAWCASAPDGGELALRLIGSLGFYWSEQRPHDGHRLAQDALALAGADHDSVARCKCLNSLALCAMRLGRYEEGQTFGERCLATARRIGATDLIVDALCTAGTGAFLSIGPNSQSQAYLTEASALARAAGDDARLGKALHTMGEFHRSSGDLVAAEQCYREAMHLSRSRGAAYGTANALSNLARVLAATGRLLEASAALGESLSMVKASGYKGMLGIAVMEVAAALASSLGEHPTAARLYGATLRQRHESQTSREPTNEAFIAPRMAQSRAAMGEDVFEAAQREGWALDYDAAVAELDRWLATRTESVPA